MSKKPIIVFEGIEGSGKSSHLASVARYLKQKKISFIKIREPGGSHNSEKIRKLMLNNKSNFNKNTDLLLFLSSRSENISLIKKNYNKKVILIDRFTDSTIAYQHYGMGVNLKLINLLNKYLLKNIKINFTFLNIVNNKSNFNKNTDLLLILSSRSENISLIKKNYNKKVILIDRFTDSTIAYQHYGMGVKLKLINLLNKYLLKNIKINFTFLNIVNNKNLFLRLKKRKSLNRYDKFNSAFYSKVQKGFVKLANSRKNSYMIIDSNLEIEKNKKSILDKIKKLI